MVRAKYRYIVTQIRCNHRPDTDSLVLDSQTLYTQIREKVQKFWGDFGVASLLKLTVKYYNEKTHLCIVQVNHAAYRFVTTTLPLMTLAGKEQARYRILYVGATMKQCNKFIIKFQQKTINKLVVRCKTNPERQRLVDAVMKVVPGN